MNIYNVFVLFICSLLCAMCGALESVELKYRAHIIQAVPVMKYDRFHVTANNKEICIHERETKAVLSVKLPSWLKNNPSIKPIIKFSPDNRFFVVAGLEYCNTYSLCHELLKPGIRLASNKVRAEYGTISEVDIYAPECEIDDDGAPILGTEINSIVCLTVKRSEESIDYSRTLNAPFNRHAKTELALCSYVFHAIGGLAAAKYLALKAGVSPLVPLPVHARSLKTYQERVLKLRKKTEITPLKPEITQRICSLIEQSKEAGIIPHHEAIARQVFSEVYVALTKHIIAQQS